jgi:hypothetical protein
VVGNAHHLNATARACGRVAESKVRIQWPPAERRSPEALRAKGLDPDDSNITQAAKKHCLFRISSERVFTRGKYTALMISEVYDLKAPIPKI